MPPLVDLEFENSLECPVCRITFDRPMQLSCGHTLCAGCADNLLTHERDAQREREGLFGHRMIQWQRDMYRNMDLLGNRRDNNRNDGVLDAADLAMIGLGGRFPLGRAGAAPIPLGVMDRPPIDEADWDNAVPPYDQRPVDRIACPECRQLTTVPVTGLPVNYRLMQLIDSIRRLERAQGAQQPPAPATGFSCSQCKSALLNDVYFMCGQCPHFRNICALCIARDHRQHEPITERKVLTDDDVKTLQQRVERETQLAMMAREGMFLHLTGLEGCSEVFRTNIDRDIGTFNQLKVGLSSMNRNATYEQAESYVTLSTRVRELMEKTRRDLDIFRRDMDTHLERLKQLYQDSFDNIIQQAPFEAPAPNPVPAVAELPPALAVDLRNQYRMAEMPPDAPPPARIFFGIQMNQEETDEMLAEEARQRLQVHGNETSEEPPARRRRKNEPREVEYVEVADDDVVTQREGTPLPSTSRPRQTAVPARGRRRPSTRKRP
ncbi:unnamed protein product, partial [Mesorhabditis spiculigera]